MEKSKCTILVALVLVGNLPILSGANDLRSTTIPFRLHSGYMIVVSARIGTLDNLNFLIDTGASRTVLDRGVAQKLGLRGEEQEVVAYGSKRKIRLARIPLIAIGGIEFAEVAVHVAPVNFRGLDQQLRIDGLIGLDLMRRTSLSIDYETFQIILGPVTHSETSFPFYGRLPIIPVSVWVENVRLSLLLDTGAKHLILYQKRAEGRLKLEQTGERTAVLCLGRKEALKQVQLREVHFGPSLWEHVNAYLLDARPSESDPDGVLGVASLGLKRLNLDFQNNKVSWSLWNR